MDWLQIIYSTFEFLTVLVFIVACPLILPICITVIILEREIRTGKMTIGEKKCSCGCFWVIVNSLPMLVVKSIVSYFSYLIITIGALLIFIFLDFYHAAVQIVYYSLEALLGYISTLWKSQEKHLKSILKGRNESNLVLMKK